MKKVILTTIAAFLLMTSFAQQSDEKKDMRQRFAELNTINDEKILEEKLKTLLQGKEEDDYLLAYYFYNNKGNEAKAEEIKKIILNKFPDGNLVFQQKLERIQEITNLHEKSSEFDALYAKYPNQSFGFVAYALAQEYASAGDESKMKQYVDIYRKGATDGKGAPLNRESVYANLAMAMISKNPDAAAPYLEEGLNEARIALNKELSASPSDSNKLIRARKNYYGMAVGYINALTAGSDPDKGYIFAKQIYDDLNAKADVNDGVIDYLESAYLKSLIKTKRFKEALPLMEKAIKKGTASDQVKQELKLAYQTVNGTDHGFKQYEDGLLIEQEKNLQEEVAKMAISQPSHDFELKDVDGNTVKLSDFRGKVVVLDFWATWCGPCKASFPAMQKAVNKFKDDKQVQFLFLHTWEKGGGDPTANAKKYVMDNNYTFKVLMDLRDPKTKQSNVATAYKVDGIPTKIIIDSKGNICFNTSGFSADADKAVKELSTMIEFAKKK